MKRFLKILSLMLMCCVSLCAFIACSQPTEPSHTHAYDKEVIDAKYLAIEATCTQKATYYYSCSCGEKGSKTFEYGDRLAHEYTKLTNSADNHWYECKCGAKDSVEAHIPGEVATETTDQKCVVCDFVITPALGHVHTLHLTVMDAKESTCTEEGNIEYYVCTCEKWFLDASATQEITDKESVKLSTISHSYTELKYDRDNHWYKCKCGAKDGVEAHIPGEVATETTDQKCTGCDFVITPAFGHVHANHLTFVEPNESSCTEEGNIEYYVCTCGRWYLDVNASQEITDKESVKISTIPHSHTELKYDGTNHWYECDCGEKDGVVGHSGGSATCTQKAKCAVCNQEYGLTIAHEYNSFEYNNDNHWYECKCGAKDRVEAHIPGESATETTDQKCTGCDFVITPAFGHVHANHLTFVEPNESSCTEKGNIEYYVCTCGRWYLDVNASQEITDKESVKISTIPHSHTELKFDGMNHWYECDCGEKDGVVGHSGGSATCTQKAKCSVCNQEYGNTLPHSYNELKYDSVNHWYECTCGLIDGESGHSGGTATCTAKAVCSVCNQAYGDYKSHDFNTIYTSDDDNHWFKCNDCSEITNFAPHSYVSGECICGKSEPTPSPYTRNGDTIYFGSYPQSKVSDTSLISTLNASAGTLPTSTNSASWTSYGYYVEGNVKDYMWYIDVEQGDNKYRGVYFTEYRPSDNFASNYDLEYTFQDDNGYSTSTVYWFKWEPISWTVLEEGDGEAIILCDMILDYQAYQNEYYYVEAKNNYYVKDGVYANNYACSSIRKWLNEIFYSVAFTNDAKQIILTTVVDNSYVSMGADTDSYGYASSDTNDKIYLLSFAEENASFTYSSAARKITTDYSESQGIYSEEYYSGTGCWWLRSPALTSDSRYVKWVSNSGSRSNGVALGGVVPALRIQLDSGTHAHSYDTLNYDSSNHWYECKCGAIDGENVHSGGTATCTAKAVCSVCNQAYGDYESHDFSTIYTSDDDNHWRKCNNCTEITDFAPHTYTSGVCVCGKEAPVYIGNGYTRVGDTVYLGEYPQSRVTDASLINALSASAGTLPTSTNPASWTSYGYYIGNNVQNYMWYIDLDYSGESYRGVYFTKYRPSWINMAQSVKDNTYQDDHGYTTSTVYWFKYEPISWTILKENDGTALILCDMIIDSQEYYISINNRTISGETIYANNYEYSTIRAWLNDNFYNTAFDSLQQQIIMTTLVDNSQATTGTSSYCNDTNDKVFLLSYSEVTNTSYGFSDVSSLSSTREKETTDYAKIQGTYSYNNSTYLNNGLWWLRSPGNDNATACYVYYNGDLQNTYSVYNTMNGIVPALRIDLDAEVHTHSYDTLNYDSSNHWYECTCGLIDGENVHSGGTATCTAKAVCSVCNQAYGDYKSHDFSTIYTSDDDNHWRKCNNCTEITDFAPHTYTSGVCVCGKSEPTQSENAYTREGDTIYFGSYPQSEVTDTSLVSTLNASAGTFPTSTDSANWTSYGYYISGSVQNYMWYIDVASSGERYRGVYFTSYRPYLTSSSSSTSDSYQDENGYTTGSVYWFKYEPISWTVLSESSGTALILCDMIVDAQEYYSFLDTRTISGATVYPNNYEYSTIRAWLNDNFYNTAFSNIQKQIVLTTTVDNSVASTGGTTNSYVCNDTNDKVFILSKSDATNSSYDITLAKLTTDYARAQGVSMTTGVNVFGQAAWWLRSPHYREYHLASTVTYSGSISDNDGGIYATSFGVVPALRIQLEGDVAEHTHSYDTLNYDSSNHWYECTCGLIDGESVHDGGTATCTAKAVCSVCNQVYGDFKSHDFSAIYTSDDDYHWRKCNDCTEITDYASHSYVSYVCVCGEIDPLAGDIYTEVDSDTIRFGSYPQSEVNDDDLIDVLNVSAGTLPTDTDSASWTSYGYYNSGSVQNYMWYIDIDEGGERYRGVYFTQYRPYHTNAVSSTYVTYQDENGYGTGRTHWFKYEPLSWTILDRSTGLILCDTIIDSQAYQNESELNSTDGEYYVKGVNAYVSNYEYSTIRAWLNDTFYNTAFTTLQKHIILTTTVDNSVLSTGYTSNKYACRNTNDQVFLLSYSEATKNSYGFSSNISDVSPARSKMTTAYAKCQGAYTLVGGDYNGNGYWWLRSPKTTKRIVHYIDTHTTGGEALITYTANGVAPALRIQL